MERISIIIPCVCPYLKSKCRYGPTANTLRTQFHIAPPPPLDSVQCALRLRKLDKLQTLAYNLPGQACSKDVGGLRGPYRLGRGPVPARYEKSRQQYAAGYFSLGSGDDLRSYLTKRFLFMKISRTAQAETAMMVTATKMSSPVEGLEESTVVLLSL